VSIVDAGIDVSTPADPRPFLVMELIRGKSIHDTLRQGALTLRQAAEIGYEVAEALDYVHAHGVIHRDITPSNVMLTDYGTVASRSRARITDFGIAIETTAVRTEAAPVAGTAAYLSPEQVRNEPLTPATDIYSLGLVMLECYTESIAFPGGAAESAMARLDHTPPIPKSIPRQWRGLLSRMTSEEPFDRPTASEVTTEIRDILRSKNW
jgi:serine/threonine protein kinase